MRINNELTNKGKRFIKQNISYIAVLVLIVIITNINPRFLSKGNISNLMWDMSPLLLMSMGLTFVLLIGSIDLSVGAVSSCASVIFAVTLFDYGWWGIVFALVFGLFAGYLSGVLFVKTRIPSFIATFGTMSIWISSSLLIAGGGSRQIPKDRWVYLDWYRIRIGVVPLPFIMVLLIMVLLIIIERKTKFGRIIYAIGGNESAARMMGLDVNRVKTIIFTLSGILSALAGVFFTCNQRGGIPTVGETFTLIAIAAVALGGTSLSGGKGGLLKTFSGILIVIIVQNGMNILGVDVFWQNILFGSVVIISVIMTTDRKQRNLIIK